MTVNGVQMMVCGYGDEALMKLMVKMIIMRMPVKIISEVHVYCLTIK